MGQENMSLQSIMENFVYASETEGEEYKYKGIRNEEIEYLISEVKRLQTLEYYSTEGMAIIVKGKMKIGIHRDNLENNLQSLSEGTMKINWNLLNDKKQ